MSESNGNVDAGKWAVVQFMGHVTKAGKVYDVEVYGAQTMRIVVPAIGDVSEYTEDYNWKNAGYSISYTTEDVVMRYLKQINAKPPVILYQPPQPATPRLPTTESDLLDLEDEDYVPEWAKPDDDDEVEF